MGEGPAASRSRKGGGSNIALFLALYLLLLAFFILLNSISRIQEVKSKAVIESVTATFAPSRLAGRIVAPPSADMGDVLAIEQAQDRIGDTVRSLVPAARVEVLAPGRLMEIVLPVAALFVEGETTLRRGRLPFLDRFVAALSAVPPGYVAELEVLFSTGGDSGPGFPVGQTPELARAGALARGLLARGMPETRLTVGLERDEPGQLRMMVRMLADTEETR